MIKDQLLNFDKYVEMNKNFKTVKDFLDKNELANLEEKVYELDGENCYAIVTSVKGKSKEEAKLEAHKKYIDIHVTLSGLDTIGWKDIKACSALLVEYDPKGEYELYNDLPENYISVEPGDFAVFFPEDTHAPLISDEIVKKIVFKVMV